MITFLNIALILYIHITFLYLIYTQKLANKNVLFEDCNIANTFTNILQNKICHI